MTATDVYVVPVDGEKPRHLTWHPGEDIVRGFTPDGKILTDTPGVHESHPSGRPMASRSPTFSDASGEYAYVYSLGRQRESHESSPSRVPGSTSTVWSVPDSKKITFLDNARTLSSIDLTSRAVKRVAAEPISGPIKTIGARS